MSWQRFTEQLREYFTFTRKERNGITVLLILLVLSQGAIVFTHYYQPEFKEADISAFEKEVMAFQTAMNDTSMYSSYNAETILETKNTATYFEFDPNTVSLEQWKMLGLKDRTIQAIQNYLSKGGHFNRKEDLKKIYNLPEQQYELLEPYIVIGTDKNEKKFFEKQKAEPKTKFVSVELNNATKEDLMTLPFIGEKRAEQIIKYRNRLGGFIKKEQLAEVYSIPDSVYQSMSPHVTINTSSVQYININNLNDSFYHPYLKKNLLKLIINYRTQHGNYVSKADLKKLPLMNDSIYNKVEGYIKVE